jgi:hypothetical protein
MAGEDRMRIPVIEPHTLRSWDKRLDEDKIFIHVRKSRLHRKE